MFSSNDLLSEDARREYYRMEQKKRHDSAVRTPPENDAEIRRFIVSTVVEAIKDIPDTVPLRFHGGRIYDLDPILESRELSSGADRAGAVTSFDSKGEISVTTPANIDLTIGNLDLALKLKQQGKDVRQAGYIDIIDTDVPVGFMAVMVPASKEEALSGELEGNRMENTLLESDKFLALVVSSEVKNSVVQKLKEQGYATISVFTYEEFTTQLPAIIQEAKKRFPYIEEYRKPVPQNQIQVSL